MYKQLVAIAAAVSAVSAAAAPWTLIAKRELPWGSWAKDDKTGCPRYLEAGQYEFPHYITHVSQKYPNTPTGPKYTGKFTPNDISSIFSFDIPKERASANCTLEFLFPKQEQLKTSAYHYKGAGTFFMKGYAPGSCPNDKTTYNNQPAKGPFPDFPPIHMEPGYAYTIDVGPCFVGAGTCVAGMTSTNDTYFEYFQDSDNCPIGIYTAYSYGLPCPPEFCPS